jgi:hypothetical protein
MDWEPQCHARPLGGPSVTSARIRAHPQRSFGDRYCIRTTRHQHFLVFDIAFLMGENLPDILNTWWDVAQAG